MIKSKYFQQGQQTIINKNSCSFSQCTNELNKINKKYLNNIKQGFKSFCLLQRNMYKQEMLKQYKDNPYLNEIFDEKFANVCDHLKLVEQLLLNNQTCEIPFFEHNMFLGNYQISRCQEPYINRNSMIYEFLDNIVIPQLKKLQIREILAVRRSFADKNKSQEEYEKGYADYLKYVIKENIDLHYYIQNVYDFLNNISDGDFYFNSVYISKDVCLLELEPFINICAISIQFFYYKLREENKQYQITKNNLPRLTLLNLDGYDHGCANYNSFKDTSKSIQYISLFSDNIVSYGECKNIIDNILLQRQQDGGMEIEYEGWKKQNEKLSGQKEKVISCLDTFNQLSDDEQRLKHLYQKHSLMLPLESFALDALTNNEQKYEYQITSGKLRKILNDIVYPAIRSFQPEIVIISYSLSMNKFSHKQKVKQDPDYLFNNLSLNEQLFSEIMTHIQTYANSKVIYCPHILKNVFKINKNHIQSNINYSFDERYYFQTIFSFGFNSKQQIKDMQQYQQNIFGSFFQVQSKQLVESLPKGYYYNDPMKTFTQIKFENTFNKYIQFIGENLNSNLKQYMPSNITNNQQTAIMEKVANYHKKEKLKDQFIRKYGKVDEGLLIDDDETQLLKYNHYVYDSIHLITKSNSEQELLKGQRFYFEYKNQRIYFTEQSQYYVDYDQQLVFIFNIISDDLTPKNYYASFKESSTSKTGVLVCHDLPYFYQDKQEGSIKLRRMLLEFSICTFQNFIMVLYGKQISVEKEKIRNIQSIINLQESGFQISNKIYYFNFEQYEKAQDKMSEWKELNVKSDVDIKLPDKFVRASNFGRLYSACVFTDRQTSKKQKKFEPILFIFGGVQSLESQQKNDIQDPNQEKKKGLSQLLCNSILRIAPLYYDKAEETIEEIFEKVWYVSMLDKSRCITTMRPFCNSQAIEINKNKILLIGGTHNKYLIPLQNEKIFAYTFTITKDTISANDNKKRQKQMKSSSSKSLSNTQTVQNEGGWQLQEVDPKQFGTQFTNAALSNLNKNIFSQKEGYTVQYLIMLNQEKYENKKIYTKLGQFHNENIIPYCCSIQINSLQSQLNGNNTESNNLSVNSEQGKDQPVTNKILKLQINHLDMNYVKNNFNLPLIYFDEEKTNETVKPSVKFFEPIKNSRSLDTRADSSRAFNSNSTQHTSMPQDFFNSSSHKSLNSANRSRSQMQSHNQVMLANTSQLINQYQPQQNQIPLLPPPQNQMIIENNLENQKTDIEVPLNLTSKNSNQKIQNSIEKIQTNEKIFQIKKPIQNQLQSLPNQQNLHNFQNWKMIPPNYQGSNSSQQFAMPSNFNSSFQDIEKAQSMMTFQNQQRQPSMNTPQQAILPFQNFQQSNDPQAQNIYKQQPFQQQFQQQQYLQPQMQQFQPEGVQFQQKQLNQQVINNQEMFGVNGNIHQSIIKPIFKDTRLQENYINEQKKIYAKAQPGSQIGMLNVVIIHLDFKQRNKVIKIEGGTFQDHQKFIHSSSQKIDFQKNYFQQNVSFQQQQQQQQQYITAAAILPEGQIKQQQSYDRNVIFNPSFGQPHSQQSYFFAVQVPGEVYYQNYIYHITVANNKPVETRKIDIQVSVKSFQAIQDKEYISPEPNKIRGIHVSECGNIFFLIYKEKQSTFHVLCCKNSPDVRSNKCMIFDKYIKYRTRAELYQYIKNQLSNPEFENYDKPKQDEEKKKLQILIEKEIQAFDQENETLDFNILVDDQYIYFLSPLIIKHMKKNPPNGKIEMERVPSHHTFLSYRSSQKDLEVIPQDIKWFKEYDENNIKCAQNKKCIVMILNKVFKVNNRENEYYLKYKIMNKINKELKKQEIFESQEYTYKFRCNINIDSIQNIQQIISRSDLDKFDLTCILIQNSNSCYKRLYSFKLTNFHEDLENQKDNLQEIEIKDSQIFRDYIFTQLQQPKEKDYFTFDDLNKQLWNFNQMASDFNDNTMKLE